jgi:hypothetical protein
MSRADKRQSCQWAEAINKEYCGLKERNSFKMIRPVQGVEIYDTLTKLTSLEFKEGNGTFLKRQWPFLQSPDRGPEASDAIADLKGNVFLHFKSTDGTKLAA